MPKLRVDKFAKSSSDVTYSACSDDVNGKSKPSGPKVSLKLKLPLGGSSIALSRAHRKDSSHVKTVDKPTPPLPPRNEYSDPVARTPSRPPSEYSRRRPTSLYADSTSPVSSDVANQTAESSDHLYTVVDKTCSSSSPSGLTNVRERNGHVFPSAAPTASSSREESIYCDAVSSQPAVNFSVDEIMTSYTPPRECSTPTLSLPAERELEPPVHSDLTPQEWLKSIEANFLNGRKLTSLNENNDNATSDSVANSRCGDDMFNYTNVRSKTAESSQRQVSDISSLTPCDVTSSRIPHTTGTATPSEETIGGRRSELPNDDYVVSINSNNGDVRIYRRLPSPTSSVGRPPPKPNKPASLELFWASSYN